MSTDNNNNDKREQLKLDVLNKIFGWIEDKETKAVMINKYYNNKEHRAALKAFLGDMVKALDESTAETNSKEEIKRQLSFIK
jgi:phage tail tube protein FII